MKSFNGFYFNNNQIFYQKITPQRSIYLRIRTYNYPQGRVTDHRINLTLYQLQVIMEGALDDVIEPLLAEHHAEQLATLD